MLLLRGGEAARKRSSKKSKSERVRGEERTVRVRPGSGKAKGERRKGGEGKKWRKKDRG